MKPSKPRITRTSKLLAGCGLVVVGGLVALYGVSAALVFSYEGYSEPRWWWLAGVGAFAALGGAALVVLGLGTKREPN